VLRNRKVYIVGSWMIYEDNVKSALRELELVIVTEVEKADIIITFNSGGNTASMQAIGRMISRRQLPRLKRILVLDPISRNPTKIFKFLPRSLRRHFYAPSADLANAISSNL